MDSSFESTLASRVYEILRHKIINLELQMGERIEFRTLGEALNVSHIPIREAVQRLVGDGLIVSSPRRGYRVCQLTEVDLWEIYDTRKMVECYALQSSPEIHDAGVFRKMLSRAQTVPTDRERFFRFDVELHATIVSLSRNRCLRDIHRKMQGLVEMSQQLGIRESEEMIRLFTEDHVSLLSAITENRISTAAQRLADHIDRSRDFRIQVIRGLKPGLSRPAAGDGVPAGGRGGERR